MTDLSRFADGSFDLIFHPVANGYIPNVLPMWRECFRVLRPGGRLLAGFTNPFVYLFDPEDQLNERRDLIVRHKVPYSDVGSLPPDELRRRVATGEPLEFSHTLDAQIGGQLAAGFVLIGFYEDTYDYTLDRFISTYVATLAIKP